MQLLNDINHLTFITADMDRLIAFYKRVFEPRSYLTWRKKVCVTLSLRWVRILFYTPFKSPVSSRQGISQCFNGVAWIILRSMRPVRKPFVRFIGGSWQKEQMMVL